MISWEERGRGLLISLGLDWHIMAGNWYSTKYVALESLKQKEKCFTATVTSPHARGLGVSKETH